MPQNWVDGTQSCKNKWGIEYFRAQSGIFLSSSNQSIISNQAAIILTDYTKKLPYTTETKNYFIEGMVCYWKEWHLNFKLYLQFSEVAQWQKVPWNNGSMN